MAAGATLAGLGQLAPPLAQAVNAMAADPQVGALTVVSGWRSEAQQVALRTAHCGPTQFDIYQKPSALCSPPTAIPGTSNHEVTLNGQPWALAVDLGGDLTDAHKVMGKYGLHTPVTGEPWHFELTNTPALAKLAKAGATPTGDGAVNLPGLGNVATGEIVLTSAHGAAPSIWLRIAGFLVGIVLLVVGLIVLRADKASPLGANAPGPDDDDDDDTSDDIDTDELASHGVTLAGAS